MKKILFIPLLGLLFFLFIGTASAQYVYTGSTSDQGLGFGENIMPTNWQDMGPAFFIWSDSQRENWTIRWSGRSKKTPSEFVNYDWAVETIHPGALSFDPNNDYIKWETNDGTVSYTDGITDKLSLDQAFAGPGYDGFNYSLTGTPGNEMTFYFEVKDKSTGDSKALGTNYEIFFDGNPLSELTDDISNGVVLNAPVPEPATMLLFGTGLLGLAGLGRRKFMKKG